MYRTNSLLSTIALDYKLGQFYYISRSFLIFERAKTTAVVAAREVHMEKRLVVALLSAGVVLVAGILSYKDGTFSNVQMMRKYPDTYSFSFIANGAMWGNFFFVSAVLYIVGKYTTEWSVVAILVALLVGEIASYGMFRFVYVLGKYPDALVGDPLAGASRPLPLAGKVIVVYFGAVLAALLLFYLDSKPAGSDVILVGILLAVYLVLANHVGLYFLDKRFHFPWCPQIFVEESREESRPLMILFGSGALLSAVTAFKLLW